MSQTAPRNLLPACIAAALVACALASSALAAAAEAPTPSKRPGFWAVTSCRENGEYANESGWVAVDTFGYPLSFGNLSTCIEAGGALTLRDEAAYDETPEQGPQEMFQPPAGVNEVAGGVVDLSMRSPGGEAYLEIPKDSGPPEYLAMCTEICTTTHTIAAKVPDGKGLPVAGAVCTAPSGHSKCQPGSINAELNITSSTILLRDEATPEAAAIAGSLTESPVAGNAAIDFTAKDAGGPGVYRATVLIDHNAVWSQTPNPNGGQCSAHGSYEEALNFRSPQPCPQETQVHIEVPTTSIADGSHLLEVELEDAAGHRATVVDKTITVQNHPVTGNTPPASGESPSTPATPTTPAPTRGPANGSPASEVATIAAHWAGTKAALSTTSAYGHTRTIDGRLTDPAGAPIVGAILEVSQRPSALGASVSAMTSTRTASDGSFSVRVPASESATVQLVYRSHTGDATPAASINLTLAVPASIHLTVSRRVASVGQAITLEGKLAGTLGVHGKHLTVEARGPGEPWLEFHGARAGSSGRFSVSHQFKFPGPVRYQFRVICEPEPAFPFVRGVSNTVSVWER